MALLSKGLTAAGVGILVAVTLSPGASAQIFTPGNLAVLRYGDGSTAFASNQATNAAIVEFTTAGANTGFVVDLSGALGRANSPNFSATGSATSEGTLRRSADGRFLTATGFDAAPGTAGLPATTSAATNRVVARIDVTGAVDRSTRLNDAYSTSNIRAAVSNNGAQFYTAGTGTAPTNGVRFVANVGDTTSLRMNSVGPTNSRVVGIYGDVLFGSNQTTIFTFGTPPPTPVAADTISPTTVIGTLANAYGFVFLDVSGSVGDATLNGLDTAYVVNDASTNSLLKFEFDGSAWVARGSRAVATDLFDASNNQVTSENGLFGLTALNGANGVSLFTTTVNTSTGEANNFLVSFLDASGFGGSLSGNMTTIAQAGANFSFRGIDLTPIPEPTSLLLAGGGLGLVIAQKVRRRNRARRVVARMPHQAFQVLP